MMDWSNKEEVVKRLGCDGTEIRKVDFSIRGEMEVMLAAVKENGLALKFIPPETDNFRTVALAAVAQNGYALEFVGDTLKSDKEVVLEAVKNKGWALYYAPMPLRNEKDFVRQCLSSNIESIKYVGDDIKADKEFLVFIVKMSSDIVMKYMDTILKHKYGDSRTEFISNIEQAIKKDRESQQQSSAV